MFRALCFTSLLALAALPAQAQSPHGAAPTVSTIDSTMHDAYRVYRPDGRPATLDDLLAAMDDADVIFVGEQHDDPVAHYLQAKLLGGAYLRFGPHTDAARPLALSLEMFERDVQPILDEYLAGLITEQNFLKSSRPWNNYESDYKPLVEFARAHGLPVVAANAPRRYVNRVSRLGPASLDSLSAWAKGWLPPLPPPGPSPDYEAKWNRMMQEMMAEMAASQEEDGATQDSTAAHPHGEAAQDSTAAHDDTPHDPARMVKTHVADDDAAMTHPHAAEEDSTMAPAHAAAMQAEEAPATPHGNGYLLDAQAFWDAAMAHAVSRHLQQTPNALVLHMAGSFHVEEGLGTPAQLEGYRPGTRRLVVVVKAQEDITTFDADALGALGDFIILTDESLPRTFESSFQ